MNVAEAHELALMHIEFAHELGEATSRQGEFWVSVSYGILVLAFVAPHALNRLTTSLVLTLYILFSISIVTNISFDLETAAGTMKDAERLINDNGIKLATFDEKSRPKTDTDFRLIQTIGALHMPGLFCATIGYVCFASFIGWRKQRQNGDAQPEGSTKTE
jgi:hypothetical protein